MKANNKIYTHDSAMEIVELFEDVLSQYSISVPSPEDDEREEDNMVGIYGTTYDNLLSSVEEKLCDMLEQHKPDTEIIKDVFSGEK